MIWFVNGVKTRISLVQTFKFLKDLVSKSYNNPQDISFFESPLPDNEVNFLRLIRRSDIRAANVVIEQLRYSKVDYVI